MSKKMREEEAVNLARKTIRENAEDPNGRAFPIIINTVKRRADGYEIWSLNPAGWVIFISFLKDVIIYKKGVKAKKGVEH